MNAADPYVLGLDLGTTTCRCAVFDLDGREVSAAYVETPVRYPGPSQAEVDPEAWWRGVTRVVRQALAGQPSGGQVAPERIAGIGVSGLMHAPVLLDAQGRPVVPSTLWMDQRCAPQCEALRRECRALGAGSRLGFSTSHTAPKLRWLAEARPQALAQAQQLLLPKDFVRYRLTGIGGTDASDAGGTGMFDRDAGEWLWEVVRLTQTPRAIVPAVRPAWALAGAVTPAAAEETGLAPGTPVAVGGSDVLCTRLGVGELAAGEACIYLGTAAWIAAAGGPGPDGRPAVRGFGATSTTGAALRWTRDLLAPAILGTGGDVAQSYDAIVRPAAELPPGAEGLLFLPHLMGERGPRADPLARGALVGLTLRHGRPHVVRAVLEGTAFQLRRLWEALELHPSGQIGPGELGRPSHVEPAAGAEPRSVPPMRPAAAIVCGGGARSPLWLQILADVTRLELRVPAVVEAGALGAAMLGAAAAGLLPLEAARKRMVRPARTHYTPAAAAARRYDELYASYCRLDDLLAPWFGRAAAAGAELAECPEVSEGAP